MTTSHNRHDRHTMHGPHRTHSLPTTRLEIVRGRARRRVRPIITNAFLIGSADDCDLVLGDPQFPEAFCYLRRSAQGVSLRYLGSGPEVTVNGEPVTTADIRHGDRIRTGPYEFRVQIDAPRPLNDDGDEDTFDDHHFDEETPYASETSVGSPVVDSAAVKPTSDDTVANTTTGRSQLRIYFDADNQLEPRPLSHLSLPHWYRPLKTAAVTALSTTHASPRKAIHEA